MTTNHTSAAMQEEAAQALALIERGVPSDAAWTIANKLTVRVYSNMEFDALTARVAELEAALRELCESEFCYVGKDADTGSSTSLYSKVKRARAALAKGA